MRLLAEAERGLFLVEGIYTIRSEISCGFLLFSIKDIGDGINTEKGRSICVMSRQVFEERT